MHRFAGWMVAAMTLIPSGLAAQAGPVPGGGAGSWSWVAVEGHPGRRFRLFVPESLTGPAPLVVMLHGCTQDPDDFARGTRFNALAAERGVVVAYPEQTAAHHPMKCWNWYLPEHQGDAGEPGMIGAVARQVMARRAIDSSRVYVAGISAGGSMAQNAAAASPGLFAAVGVHSGIAFQAARDVPGAMAVMRGDPVAVPTLVSALTHIVFQGARPPALIGIQGEADAVVSPRNIALLYVQWSAVHGAGEARDDSLQVGGRGAVRTLHQSDDGTPEIELWRVQGLGHAWSGGSPEGTYTDPRGPDASRLMLDFFLSHPKPVAP